MMELALTIFEAVLDAYDVLRRLFTRSKLPERPAVEMPSCTVTIDITEQRDGLRKGYIEWYREHRGEDLDPPAK